VKTPAHFCQINLMVRPVSATGKEEQQIAVNLA